VILSFIISRSLKLEPMLGVPPSLPPAAAAPAFPSLAAALRRRRWVWLSGLRRWRWAPAEERLVGLRGAVVLEEEVVVVRDR